MDPLNNLPPGDKLPDPDLPDGTRSANALTPKGSVDVSAADLDRGFIKQMSERIPLFSDENTAGENSAGDPFTFGGFLGRPHGWQR